MVITFHKTFHKELEKLSDGLQEQVYKRLELFVASPYDALLHNHPLIGKYKGYFSINITGDVRALYKIVDYETVKFVRIGTHSKLYK